MVEASNNVVEHGYKQQAGHEIKFEADVQKDRIIFTIEDFGVSIPSDILETSNGVLEFNPEDTENLPEGGFGLEILRMVMGDIYYSSNNGTNSLILTHYIENTDIVEENK